MKFIALLLMGLLVVPACTYYQITPDTYRTVSGSTFEDQDVHISREDRSAG